MEENLNPTVETTGEEDLMEAIRQFKEMESSGEFTDELTDEETDDQDSEDTSDEEDSTDEEEIEEDDEEVEEDDSEDEEEIVEETPKKKVQSKEDNAKFAAERRQRELDAKVQEELERIKMSSPEYQLANLLAKQYGTTPDVIVKQLQEQQLQEQAQKQGVPVEYLREIQETKAQSQRLQDEINQLKFQQWQGQIQVEKARLQTEFPMLNSADMDSAVDYMLTQMKNPNIPLEQVLYAVHGKKIIDGYKKNTEQEILAKESGRSKKPLAPKSGKPSETQTLTDEERYVARQMGLSDDDYLKYK